ncbi:MAG: hypothetical protein GY737_04010 [Desulfobacteraceae bacterium]|nr:hypothetical protein [Desulfobacteraceae bacterium]
MKPGSRAVWVIVFVTSFTLIGHEIALARVSALVQWHNLAAIIIGMAMLGFGASGSVIMVLGPLIERHLGRSLLLFTLFYPLSLTMGFILYCKIPFNPFEVGLDPNQIVFLLLKLAAMAVPFFFGAMVVGTGLRFFKISRIYFANLTGSGLGALAVVFLLYQFHPMVIVIIIIATALVPFLVLLGEKGKPALAAGFALSMVWTGLLSLSVNGLDLTRVSQYKAISGARALPDAKILAERFSPLSTLQAVEATGLRSTPGLSLITPVPVPVHKGLFYDGQAMSPIAPYSGDNKAIAYLDHMPPALAHHLVPWEKRERILIVGMGGGEGILGANLHGFRQVVGLEVDRNVIDLMETRFADFSGDIYNQENLVTVNQDARAYARRAREKFDLIEIRMIDAAGSATAGLAAMHETYLYTVEAIREFLNLLSPHGVLAISRWITTPPRDVIKMANIIVHALKRSGIEEPANHLILIRSLQTATLVVSNRPFSREQIEITREFCGRRLFDLIHHPGIRAEETRRFIQTERPVYHDAVQALVSEDAADFERTYPFDITPAIDDRPYFYHFFRWRLVHEIRQTGTRTIAFTQWGYLLLLILLGLALGASLLFILLPLAFARDIATAPLNLRLGGYFSAIAIGFFFVEIPLMQKLILFLSAPAVSMGVILASLLMFSGLGAWWSDRIFPGRLGLFWSNLLVSGLILIYWLGLDKLLTPCAAWPTPAKMLAAMAALLPLGMAMGLPFPKGLTRVKGISPARVAWAFGVNNLCSVIATLGAALIAILFGFDRVLSLAALFYLGAAMVSLKLGS